MSGNIKIGLRSMQVAHLAPQPLGTKTNFTNTAYEKLSHPGVKPLRGSAASQPQIAKHKLAIDATLTVRR
jgi:hypothetical protein